MALKAPNKEHSRKTTLVFDPKEDENQNYCAAAFRKKNVAAYARVSTEQDAQQNSYEAQIEYYTGYIQSKPEWNFVGVYSDEGISGTGYKNRAGFNRMLDDAKAGKIDLILTKSISRFSRNTVDSLSVTRELKAHGVEVYFEKENISSMDTQAELIFTIMSSVAQEESRSLSENVKWGKERSMEAGNVYVPYKSFLGYKRGEDGFPEIVEEEAEIVRRIYKRYLEGATLKKIADELTNDGIKTPMGKDTWTNEGIRRILTNEKYKGDARLRKTYIVDFLTKKTKKNNGERRQWYVHDSHDPIVSPETFELVQTELARRLGRHGRFYDSPFTGKIVCGDCGAFYGHRVWHSTSPCRKYIWLCNDKYKGNAICRPPRVTEQEIELGFIKAVKMIIKDKLGYIDEYEKEFLPLIGETDDLKKQLIVAKEELDGLIEQIEELIQNNARRAQDQSIYAQNYNALKETIELKQAQIEIIEKSISTNLVRRENAKLCLEGLRNTNSLIQKFDISTWHALVDYVKVMSDKTLIFHFRNEEDISIPLEEVH